MSFDNSFLLAFILASQKQLNETGKDDYRNVLGYIRESTDDLESSQELFKVGKYRNSILLLAQSIEKISKGLFVHLGIITDKRAKEISHFTLKLWKDLTDSYLGQLGLLASGYDPDQMEKRNEDFNELMNRLDEIVELSYEDIIELLRFSDEIESYTFGLITTFLPRNERREFIMNWAKSISQLYYISFIVFSHYHFGRYQAQKEKVIEYTAESPVVQAFDEIVDRLEFCITSLTVYSEELYKRNKNRV